MENQSMLTKRDNETDLQYHKRLVNGKLVDKTLADYDYSELAKFVYGKDYSTDVARRMMYGSQKTLELLDNERISNIADGGIIAELDAKIIELQKEKQKFYDYRTAFNKVVREQSRYEELDGIISDAIINGNIPALNPIPNAIGHSSNDLLVSLNDIHYGASVNNAWQEYNSDICAEMFRNYLDKIIEIIETHHPENCIVVSAGDLLNGNIHYSIAVSNKENVVQQIIGVSELISNFLAELSKYFNTVQFVSVAGNHSRINPNKDNALVGERLDVLPEWYLKARLQNFDNIIIDSNHKLDDTVSAIHIRDKLYAIVHGDYDDSPGKIQGLQTMIRAALNEDVYAVFYGHKHHNAINDVQGTKTIMAGSFLGVDEYCVGKRIYGKPEQMVCVCNNDGVLCYYGVPLLSR